MFNYLYFKNTFAAVINRFSFSYRLVIKNGKLDHTSSKSYHCSPNRAFKVGNTRSIIERAKSNTFYINTNVQNNVLLYRYVNNSQFRGLQFLMYGWICCCITSACFSYTSEFTLIWTTDINWKDYIRKYGMQLIVFFCATVLGVSYVMLFHLLFKRYIKSIILHKGGKHISIITHHIFKKEQVLTMPVNKVYSTISRQNGKSYIPLKISGKNFHYVIDCRGKFFNEKLFDNTIGIASSF